MGRALRWGEHSVRAAEAQETARTECSPHQIPQPTLRLFQRLEEENGVAGGGGGGRAEVGFDQAPGGTLAGGFVAEGGEVGVGDGGEGQEGFGFVKISFVPNHKSKAAIIQKLPKELCNAAVTISSS